MAKRDWAETVLSHQELQQAKLPRRPPLTDNERVGLAQAKTTGDIAFEAGMRKVVEWLEERCLNEYVIEQHLDFSGKDMGRVTVGEMTALSLRDWEAQKKEWGL